MPNATVVNLQIIISISFEIMSFTHRNRKNSLSDSGIETYRKACFILLFRAILFNQNYSKISMIRGSVFGPVSKQSFKDGPSLLPDT